MVNTKVSGLFVSSFVVLMLVLAGPVNALNLSMDGFRNTPYSFNDSINFVGSVDIETDEIVNLQNVSVEVNDVIVCVFDLNGNAISGCNGFNVSLISNNSSLGYGYGYNNFDTAWKGSNMSSNAGNYNGHRYGYGYGYNYGKISYNISIVTPQSYFIIPGNNDIKLIAQTTNQMFNSRIEKIVIQPQPSNSGGNGNGNGNGNNNNDNEGGRRNNNGNNNFNNLGNPNSNNSYDELAMGILKNSNGGDSLNTITGAVTGENSKTGKYVLWSIGLFLATLGVLSYIIYRRKNWYKQGNYNFY